VGGLRPAFTLIELIIVITIIAILAALTTGAVMRYYSVQQQTNTEVTLRKVYEHLKDQWDTVIRQANQEPISPQAMAIAGGPGFEKQARVIHIKLRLKQEFPMDFNEIANPYPTDLPPLRMYQDAIAAMPVNAGVTVSTPRQVTPIENATCLYLALQRSRGGASLNFDDLGSNAVATDNSGYQKWIVDGWRTPIIYFRWATKNTELDGLNPAAPGTSQFTYRDPQDPTGALFDRNWWIPNHNWTPNPSTSVWTSFESQCHSLIQIKSTTPPDLTWPYVPPTGTAFPWNSGPFPNQPPPAPPAPYYVWAYEYYTIPVVASAGPNKNFGIYFPSLTPNPATGTCFSVPNPMVSISPTDTNNYGSGIGAYGDDNDNIYSYRLRLGARGD
jgi:prepilin-type N-terminal cleavage/methylation domain-containing protein